MCYSTFCFLYFFLPTYISDLIQPYTLDYKTAKNVLSNGIPRLLYTGNGKLLQHSEHKPKGPIFPRSFFYAALATQFFAMLFHKILPFPQRDIFINLYKGKKQAVCSTPPFQEYWKIYMSQKGESSSVPQPPKPTSHEAEHVSDDDGDFEQDDDDNNLAHNDDDKRNIKYQRGYYKKLPLEHPRKRILWRH